MIIDFKKKKDNQEYNELLKECSGELAEISSRLFDMGVKLALAGKWKEWSDSVPVGTMMNFNDEMLLDSGDETVQRVVELSIDVENLTVEIDKKTG